MHTNEIFSIVKMWKKLKLTWSNVNLPTKYRPSTKNPTKKNLEYYLTKHSYG